MKSSSKIVVTIVAAGMLVMGAAAVAASGTGDCAGGRWMGHDGVHGARLDPAARAEQRLARLKTELKITPEQEPLWQAFADKVGSEAGKGFEAMRAQAKDESLTAPERLARATDNMKQRLAAMESIGDAFNRLYQGLTPEQRKLADERADRMAGAFGGRHPDPIRHRGPASVDPEKG